MKAVTVVTHEIKVCFEKKKKQEQVLPQERISILTSSQYVVINWPKHFLKIFWVGIKPKEFFKFRLNHRLYFHKASQRKKIGKTIFLFYQVKQEKSSFEC